MQHRPLHLAALAARLPSMLIGIVIAMGLLAVLNAWSAKSFLYPPALFAAVWTISLVLLCISQSTFFRVGDDTLFFYFCGTLAFTGGGWCWSFLAGAFSRSARKIPASISPAHRRRLHLALDILLLALLAGLPFYWHYLLNLAAETNIPDLWVAIRAGALEQGTETPNMFHMMDNLVVLAMILALVTYFEDDGSRSRRIRTCLTAGIAFVYTFASATRASGISLALSLLALYWLKHGRIGRRALAVFVLVFSVVFSGLGILVRKGAAQPEQTISENVPALVDGFLWYSLGGIVAFDTVLHAPTTIPATQSVFRPIFIVASKLGFRSEVPLLHAEYTPIGPGKETNIYTMYFSYYPLLGFAGTMWVVFLLGLGITATYNFARCGDTLATFAFSVLFAGIFLSPYAENLVSSMNYVAKLLLSCWVFYGWRSLSPGRKASRLKAC